MFAQFLSQGSGWKTGKRGILRDQCLPAYLIRLFVRVEIRNLVICNRGNGHIVVVLHLAAVFRGRFGRGGCLCGGSTLLRGLLGGRARGHAIQLDGHAGEKIAFVFGETLIGGVNGKVAGAAEERAVLATNSKNGIDLRSRSDGQSKFRSGLAFGTAASDDTRQ